MAGADKTVKVRLELHASPYVKGTTEAAAATNKLGRDIDGVGQKSQAADAKMGKLSGSLKGLGAAAGVAAGAGLVAFLTDAVAAAGNLQQSVGGVDAVFGGMSEKIHDFGKESADAVGLSTNAFNELVTVTGAMLKNKGLEDFADKSIELVKVGADLSATFGGSAKDAVEALNAAMRGESDPIERYGISLNETAVNAELAAKGVKGLTGEQLEQAKAQARIEIIMRQSADATGAFAREADTLQGQQQRLNAEWEDAKATLGTALLPVLTDVMSALRGGVDVVLAVAGAWEKVPGPVKAAVAAFAAFKLLSSPVGKAAGSMRLQLQRLREEMALQQALAGNIHGGYRKLGDETTKAGTRIGKGAAAAAVGTGALRTAGSGLMSMLGGPWGIAIAGAAVALGGFMQAQQEADAAAKELLETMDKQTGAFTDASRVKIRDALMGDLSGADQKLLQDIGVSFTEAADATLAGGDKLAAYIDKINALRENNPEAIRAIQGLGQSIRNNGDVASDARLAAQALAKEEALVGDEAKDATPKLKGYEDIVGGIHQISEDAEQATKDLAAAILEVADAAVSADEAESNYQASVDAARASIEEHGKTVNKNRTELDLSTEAGRANAEALRGLRDDALAVAEANLTNGDSVDSVKLKMQDAREEFIRNAQKMGLTKDAAKLLADEYGLTSESVDGLKDSMGEIPEEVVSRLTLETSEAVQRLKYFKLMYDNLGNKTVTLSAVVQTQGFEAAQAYRNRFATGGAVMGPGTATSDSIPAYLSNGEYVVKAAAVAKYGRSMFDGLNAMRFADGGYVSRMSSPAASIDYDRLAAAVGGRGGVTFNAYGQNADDAAQRAMRDWEWRNRA